MVNLAPFPRQTTIENRKFLPPCVFNALLKGFPLELGIGTRGQKTRMTVLPDGQKVSRHV